jgi:2-amino-4-hydroxy-6-hydroxymethyldihydropteridine diphosphokinase
MDYVLGLGANLGSRENQLQAGLELLVGTRVGRVVATSHVFESEPIGPPQPSYLNAAARVQSELEPHALLHALLAIERALGRERRERWGARTLDLDILWAERRVESGALRVPHPRLRERWFAYVPLLEVAPELAGELGLTLPAGDGEGGFETRPYEEGARAFESRRYDASARRLHRLALESRAEVDRDRSAWCVSGQGLDLADALAATLTAAGRALWPQLEPSTLAVEVVRVASSDPPGALLAALDQRAQHGHAFTRVLVSECSADALEARVLGAADGAAQSNALQNAKLWAAAAGIDGHRVQLELGNAVTATRTG